MERRREELIEEHITLVDHVVRRVATSFPGYVDRSELLGAGRLGLTEAACRYDFDLQVPFAPYAARRIRGAVLDHLRQHDWVPRSMRDLSREADRTAASMSSDSGEHPDDDALAARLDTDTASLRQARHAATSSSVRSLDSAYPGAGAPHEILADRTAPSLEEVLENRELHGYLRAALDSLPERLRLIVVGHYLEGRSLDDIAVTLGLTPSRISQLRSDAIEILRHGIDAQFAVDDDGTVATADPPKGRVAIRQAHFAASVARHADWRTRLARSQYGHGLVPPAASEVSHSA